MSAQKLRDRVSVRCSIADAHARLQMYFVARLPLRVDGVVFAAARVARRDGDPKDAVRIRFGADGGGPYPAFEGALALWADEHPGTTFMELDGTYEAPPGAVGLAWRIGRALLLNIARAIADRP